VPRIPRAAPAALLVAPLVLTSCYSFATPSYHPGDARQLLAAIGHQGVTVESATPGESACDDPGLIPNAMHLVVADPDGGATRDVWIYSFREKAWSTSQRPVDDCQASYEAANPGAVVSRVDIPLYRAIGTGWSASLTQALESGFAEAADAGEPG
jgi:hypothetical protein